MARLVGTSLFALLVSGFLGLAGASAHSEPAPTPSRTAVVSGTALVAASSPHGVPAPKPRPAGGVQISLKGANGTLEMVTPSNGRFALKTSAGSYALTATIGPPHSTPVRVCLRRHLHLRAHEQLTLRVVCDLK